MKETLKNNKEFVVLVWIAVAFTVMAVCLVLITLDVENMRRNISYIESNTNNLNYVSGSIEDLGEKLEAAMPTVYPSFGR